MGRKITEEEREEKKENVKDDPVPPESRNESDTHTELTALDFLNILTRKHLNEMLNEYADIITKHNLYLNKIDETLNSCLDLKKEEKSRLDQLKAGYFNVCKVKPEKAERMKIGRHKTGSPTHIRKGLTSTKNVILNEALKNKKDIHKINVETFIESNRYVSAGFNKFRYDQCPNVKLHKNIMNTGVVDGVVDVKPNRVLQETMLSLKITEHHMIREDPKGDDIRILNFDVKQERNSVEFHINIPKISKYDKYRIVQTNFEAGDGVGVYVYDHNGKNYIFELSNFANKIKPKSVKLSLIEQEDKLIIEAEKKKPGEWQELFNYKNETKGLWEEEMKRVLKTMGPDAQMNKEEIDFVWNIALILANSNTDFLNLPQDLNHVNKSFNTLEEMIFYYKTMIRHNPTLKALFYIPGGALCSKLLKSSSPSNLKKPLKKNVHSTYEKETVEEITKLMEMHAKNYEEGNRLFFERKYDEAKQFFDKALSFCTVPIVHAQRCVSLFEMGRYEETIMDAIFAIRNLGPYEGIKALLTILKLKIKNGSVIYAIDTAISFEFDYKEVIDEEYQLVLKNVRRNGIHILKNIFKSYSLIFQKKYKDAIPFLEEVESIITIKYGHTSVILLFLYFIYKNYDKVFTLGNEILKNCNIYGDLVLYVIGMSAYYRKQLNLAINYLEKIQLCPLRELAKVKLLRDLIHKADNSMRNDIILTDLRRGGYEVAEALVDDYNRAKRYAEDNDQLLAHIWTKLGVLNFASANFEEAIEYLTSAIKVVGGKKNILVVRSEAYKKLAMANEAKKESEAAHNLMVNEAQEDRDEEQEL